MFIDLSLATYKNSQQIVSPKIRSIGSETGDISKFVNTLYTHLLHNNCFKKLDNLYQQLHYKPRAIRIANEIDDQISQGFNTAIHTFTPPPRPPWSKKLHHASLTYRY